VSCKHYCAFDLLNSCGQRAYPIRAARSFPIFLLKTVIFGMLGVPKALPVFGARVEKTREDQDLGARGHSAILNQEGELRGVADTDKI
jgi:hypothetical protein